MQHGANFFSDFAITYYERLSAARSLDDVGTILFDAADALGLRFIACGVHRSAGGANAQAFLFHNYPAGWTAHYQEKGYGSLDPVLRHAERCEGAFLWDDPAFLERLSERQRRLLNEARAFGVTHGLTIPLARDIYLPVSISAVTESGDMDLEIRRAVGVIGVLVFQRARMILAGLCDRDEEKLTARERDCLDLKAHGAATREIASRLGISAATVSRHLEQAKLRLKAKSREHAIWRAVETRQIL